MVAQKSQSKFILPDAKIHAISWHYSLKRIFLVSDGDVSRASTGNRGKIEASYGFFQRETFSENFARDFRICGRYSEAQ